MDRIEHEGLHPYPPQKIFPVDFPGLAWDTATSVEISKSPSTSSQSLFEDDIHPD